MADSGEIKLVHSAINNFFLVPSDPKRKKQEGKRKIRIGGQIKEEGLPVCKQRCEMTILLLSLSWSGVENQETLLASVVEEKRGEPRC